MSLAATHLGNGSKGLEPAEAPAVATAVAAARRARAWWRSCTGSRRRGPR
ncbi:hypothetical protein ABZX30_35760 [Streptomyces sp. NPDC004542]